jgi:hypothetical protein
LTVTFALAAVRVAAMVLVVPTVTEPMLAVVGDAASVPAAVPVPESVTARLGFDALEATVSVPASAPAVFGSKVRLKVMLPAGVSVSGGVMPVLANTAELKLRLEILTDAVPVLVRTSCTVLVVPSATLPKATEAWLAASLPTAGAVPVPDNGTASEAFDPFDAMVSVAPTAPAVFGAKLTLKLTLAEGAIETGSVTPLIANEVELEVIADTLTAAVPELVRVSWTVLVVPSVMLPKAIEVWLAVSLPTAGAVPVPDIGTASEAFDPFDAIVSVPLAAPAVLGAKFTLKLMLAEGAIETGSVTPLIANEVELDVIAETLTAAVPELVRVS